jgi:hypothetical protein
MGYRRLKEKVKEYNRRDAKLYGNMISKLSKLDSGEGNVSFHHPRLCATIPVVRDHHRLTLFSHCCC